uniref:Uncharacterized protein n=1 Tax=Panagrolaimus sp. PS1159 TaxID=55785 RepID=A0AC35FP78_9BILA
MDSSSNSKKAIKEYNNKSRNSCYYYPAFIIGVNKYDSVIVNICRINVTLGLTTIKKSKIKSKWVKFPSYFEVDKTLRKDIVIKCNERLESFPTIYHRDGAPLVF